MNSHCTDQLVHSNLRTGLFQEINDQTVDIDSLNCPNLLLFTVLFDNSQFSFFFFLVQNIFLLKMESEFESCCFLSRFYLLTQARPVSPSQTVHVPFVPRCSHMFSAPFRWDTHLLGLGASVTGHWDISLPHQRRHIITLSLSWHLFYCKGLSLLENPPNSLIAVY